MNKKSKRKIKKEVLIVIPIIIVIIILIINIIPSNKKSKGSEESNINKSQKENLPNINIIDLKSDSRNIAIMYNNISAVWGNQAGLQDAYLVYEIIVEGGYTRLMAVFKDTNIDRIGCIRSSRPYFLDYVLENDAIYVHFGASKQALSDIETLGINNINFINYNAGYWRDKTLNLSLEHTAYTSSELINKGIEKYSYRNTSSTKPVLNYTDKEIDLSSMEGAIKADSVFIDYSAVRNTSYIYDSVNKVYLRSQGTARNSYKHIDAISNKQYSAKNIITYKVKNKSIDSKNRQVLENIGSGDGYYVTNGYAVPIKWSKKSRDSKTIYTYNNGKEISVNDGNTFIQIQPSNEELIIK